MGETWSGRGIRKHPVDKSCFRERHVFKWIIQRFGASIHISHSHLCPWRRHLHPPRPDPISNVMCCRCQKIPRKRLSANSGMSKDDVCLRHQPTWQSKKKNLKKKLKKKKIPKRDLGKLLLGVNEQNANIISVKKAERGSLKKLNPAGRRSSDSIDSCFRWMKTLTIRFERNAK